MLWEGDLVGLYYMRGRWYDPAVGRFIQEDPLGVDDGINLYAFSGDDPVNGSDPSGMVPGDGSDCRAEADREYAAGLISGTVDVYGCTWAQQITTAQGPAVLGLALPDNRNGGIHNGIASSGDGSGGRSPVSTRSSKWKDPACIMSGLELVKATGETVVFAVVAGPEIATALASEGLLAGGEALGSALVENVIEPKVSRFSGAYQL